MVEIEVERVKEKLDIEATERCRAIVEAEVGKMKSKMELENCALRKEIEIGMINYQSMKKNYRTIIACTWILIILYLVMIWRTSNGEVKHNHMLFP
jgi:ketopantoate reductase